MDLKTCIHDHIDQFSKLQQKVDYNELEEVPPMSTKEINLVFLTSLAEQCESFHQSNAHRAYTMKTAELFAEVTIIDNSKASQNSNFINSHLALHSKVNDSNKYGKKRKFESNSNLNNSEKPYVYCHKKRHHIRDCLKKRWKNEQANDNHDISYEWKVNQ